MDAVDDFQINAAANLRPSLNIDSRSLFRSILKALRSKQAQTKQVLLTAGKLSANLLRKSWDHKVILWLFSIFCIYVYYWSYVTIRSYFAIHQYVYDLGLFMENNWLVLHTHWTLYQFVLNFLNQGLKFIIFPISFPNSYPFLLVVQSVIIAASIFPIFGISEHLTGDWFSSVLIASSYLIFFPVAGINWFGAHFQAYFPLLFFTGYYFFIREKYVPALTAFFVSGLVRYPFAVFPLLFAITLMVELLWRKAFQGTRLTENKNKLKFGILLMLSSGLLLSLGLLFLGERGVTTTLVIHYTALNGNTYPAFYNLDIKILTVIIVLASVFFLPLHAPRWLPMLSVYFFLVFYSNYPVYEFPEFITHQYGSLYVVFLYLGSIESISRIDYTNHLKYGIKSVDLIGNRKSFSQKMSSKRKLSILFISCILLFGIAYLPYGPLNKYSQADFDLSGSTNVNMTRYAELTHLVNMIPNNASRVFIQDNIPQLFPRPLIVDNYLVMGLSVPYNLSFQTQTGAWIKLMPEYVLTYPYMAEYSYTAPYPLNISMFQLARNLYGSGNYGILGEAYGMVLLKQNYTGPIVYYVPYSDYFPANALSPLAGTRTGSTLVGNNITSNETLWEGPGLPLSPGKYKATFMLKTTNTESLNSLTLAATVAGAKDWLNATSITGNDFTHTNSFQNFTLYFVVSNFEINVNLIQFPTLMTHWQGAITLSGIWVQQISPLPQ